jgi:pimeloyl-ACP methyl ester carboxylesterase
MKGGAVRVIAATALLACACASNQKSSPDSGANNSGGPTEGGAGPLSTGSPSASPTPTTTSTAAPTASNMSPAGMPGVKDSGAGGDATANAGDGGAMSMSGGDGGQDGAGTDSFAMCVAGLKPNCDMASLMTVDQIQTPCSSITFIPIPLTDGGAYGPVSIAGGPYGGQVLWNQGANTSFVNQVNASESICVPVGIETFAQPASVNAQIENTRGVDYSLYTIFRPACFKDGEKYPVITWANGTCGEIIGYAALLATVASYGFVIVASNSTWTATAPTDTVQLTALDYAKSLNEDSNSAFYQRLDMDKIGAMGHSQGASATGNASSDSRIKALLFWNSGTSNNKPFLDVSGDQDIGTNTPSSMTSDVNAATQPGAWVYYHQVLDTGGNNTGHLVLMEQPDRVWKLAVSWWQYILNGDANAKTMFIGSSCGLCSSMDQYEYGHNSMLQ